MEKEIRKNALLSFGFLAGFLLYILLIKRIDVQCIGPAGSEIGWAAVNGWVHEKTGVHELLYEITNYQGVVAMIVGFLICCGAPYQFMQSWNLKKVNQNLLVLIAFYFLLGGIYILFEIAVVNYRPVLMEGELFPEASFPSSHTVLGCCVMGSILVMLELSGENGGFGKTIKAVLWGMIAFAVIGRLLCGMHWLTDILGGTILSTALLFGFKTMLLLVKRKEERLKQARGKAEKA